MSTMEIISYLSLGFGVLGVSIAFYQGFERKRLKQYVRSQAWHVYSMTNISFGAIQAALKYYKETSKANIDPILFEQLSKSEAYNVALFLETIRQIQLSEPEFSMPSIMRWQMEGKVPKEQVGFFFRMATMETPGMFSLFWQSLTIKLKDKFIQRIQTQQAHQKTQENSKAKQEVS